ncbi:MAG TPA: YnbE family lipoprotein [Asticcacaulis sp.]|nr:YnbE family lipoprotein [Asticcacaulis sp.]
MTKKFAHISFAGAAAALGALALVGCTPSVNVNVNLAPIYAKLDVNVKVQLDKDVQALAQQNPNLF